MTEKKCCCGGAESGTEPEVNVQGESCCHQVERSDEEIRDLLNRLSRIEGQLRGIRKMVESGAYCVDILTQVSATSCAMNSFSKELLARHIRTCVTDDIRSGSGEKVDELVKMLKKMLR